MNTLLASQLSIHRYSNTQFTCAGLTNGQNVLLDSVVIPANTIGPNGALRVSGMYTLPGAGANTKDPLVRVGVTSGTFATAANIVNNQGFTTQKSYQFQTLMHNKGVQNSNVWYPAQSPVMGTTNSPANATAVDFSQSVTIYFGGTCLNAFGDPTDIVRLEMFTVEVFP